MLSYQVGVDAVLLGISNSTGTVMFHQIRGHVQQYIYFIMTLNF